MAQMNPMAGSLPPDMPGMPDPAGADMGMAPPPPADPMSASIDPNSLAGVIASAIADARAQGHAQLDEMQDSAAQAAQAHPVVQAMMQPPPSPPMGSVAGGALPPMAPPPPGMGGY